MRLRSAGLLPAFALVALGAIPAGAAGASDRGHSITVPLGGSIQAAVDSAVSGDVIRLRAGVYHESVVIQKDGITIRGAREGGTELQPPADPSSGCAASAVGEPDGICILAKSLTPPPDPQSPPGIGEYVFDTTIKNLTVRGFGSTGVFAFGADGLVVSNVHAVDNGGYGIARFASKHTVMKHNLTEGSGEAGLYLGDSPDADSVIVGNVTRGNGYGIFLRNSQGATVEDNISTGNCVGILVLAGAPGPSGHYRIADNRIVGNNRVCPANDGAPPLSGLGVFLVGANDTTVEDNVIRDNGGTGDSIAKGGVVLLSSAAVPGLAPIDPTNNVIRDNRLSRNTPDLVYDGSGSGNSFSDNRCSSSTPAGLCKRS